MKAVVVHGKGGAASVDPTMSHQVRTVASAGQKPSAGRSMSRQLRPKGRIRRWGCHDAWMSDF